MLTGFLLPGAARRAMVAGAIGLIAGAHAAGAAVVGSDSGFTLVGDAGTTILFDPYPFPTSFEASVKSAYQAGVTIDGSLGFATLTFNGPAPPAVLYGGGVYEQALDGTGSLTLYDGTDTEIGSATLSGGAVFATPGASTATIELDSLRSPERSRCNSRWLSRSGGRDLFPGGSGHEQPNLLLIQPTPCAEPYFDPIRLDWTATYQATPYKPGGSAAPEPSTWALMVAGFAGLGFMGWRRGRGAARVSFSSPGGAADTSPRAPARRLRLLRRRWLGLRRRRELARHRRARVRLELGEDEDRQARDDRDHHEGKRKIARLQLGSPKPSWIVCTQIAATATPIAPDICCDTLAELVARLIRGCSMSA